MQVDVPQISWHDESARIMSIDFYPNSLYFVTTSQSTEYDTGIRFWKLIPSTKESTAKLPLPKYDPQHQYDLQGGHQSTVNCARFSHDGQFLASGSDDQMIIIWTLRMAPVEFGKTEETI